MPKKLKFIFALHNHQPVGNFDHIIEGAYNDAYGPLMEVLARHKGIPYVMHYSGSLLEWLEGHHPEFCTLIADAVGSGRMELMGGGYYEPIFTMLPDRDLMAQVRTFTAHLKVRYRARVRGAWVPERVWEQCLASPLARGKIDYVALDDYHFKAAGLTDSQLTAHYITEDQGDILAAFPILERLRYLIPFATPEKCIEYILSLRDEKEDRLLVYADDGEKFGTWPGTHKLVYDEGWLDKFLTLLEEQGDRIEVVTFSEALDTIPPAGRIYLPDCSYREMTEWALQPEALIAYEDEIRLLETHDVKPLLRGGFWRNFKAKYPEANNLYARMLLASEAVASIAGAGRQYMAALTHLFRGQCNCPYWHGVFGGLYLPHLRDAAWGNLIQASRIAASVHGSPTRNQPHLVERDLDLDGRNEILMENGSAAVFIKPSLGAEIYEIDLFDRAVNLVDTLSRKKEAYHKALLLPPEPVEGGSGGNNGDVESIHSKIKPKEAGLERLLVYDRDLRYCLIDRVLAPDTTLEQMQQGRYVELAEFAGGEYQYEVESRQGPAAVLFHRLGAPAGKTDGAGLFLTKKISLLDERAIIKVEYRLQNRTGRDIELIFSSELNVSMQSGRAPDRYYLRADGKKAGMMSASLEIAAAGELTLVDEWRRFRLKISSEPACDLWTYPVETVSISEAGLERIFQAACVIPWWRVRLGDSETFEAELGLAADAAGSPAAAAGSDSRTEIGAKVAR